MSTWVTSSLGDVVTMFSGNSISDAEKKKNFLEVEGTPYIGTKDVKFDTVVDYENGVRIPHAYSEKFRLAPAGSVLICSEGGSAGRKIAITDRPVNFGNKLFALSSERILGKYLFYYCFSTGFQKQFRDAMSGVIGGVSIGKFKEIKISFPSLDEQAKIVSKLDDLFDSANEAISDLAQAIKLSGDLFNSLLEETFLGEEGEWQSTELQNVLAKQPRNGWSPPAANHSDEGTPVLTLSAVTGFSFKVDKIKYTSAAVGEGRHYWVNDGDLLITRSNTPELVGHVAIAQGIEEPTIYPDLIMKMEVDATKALTEFLYYQLRSPKLREIIKGRAQGANPTMKKIDKSGVQTLPINVTSIAKQKQAVKKLAKIEMELSDYVEACESKISCLNGVKQSVLDSSITNLA
jgi:type I restriction enzyme S subunit